MKVANKVCYVGSKARRRRHEHIKPFIVTNNRALLRLQDVGLYTEFEASLA